MKRWLVIVQPKDDAGVVQEHRFSAGLKQPWRVDAFERVGSLPTLSVEVMRDGFGRAGSVAGIGTLGLINNDGALDELLSLAWRDAVIQLYRTDLETPDSIGDFTQVAELRGEAIAQSAEGLITLTLKDLSGALDVPLNLPRYAGTGGAEGPEEFKDKVKPFAIGPQFNVSLEGKFVNRNALIAQVHSRAMGGVLESASPREQGVTDKGVPLINGGDYASYADLVAVDMSGEAWDGKFATCNAEGLIRLARQPKGVAAVDFRGDADAGDGGYVELPGAVIQRVIDALWSGAGITLDTAALAALDTDFPHPVKLYADKEGIQVSDWIETVALSVGAMWWVDELATLRAKLFAFDAPSATIYDWRSKRPELLDAWPRWNKLVIGYGAPTRVMSEDELAEISPDTIDGFDDALPIVPVTTFNAPNLWRQDKNDGAWTPAGTTADGTVEFRRADEVVATRTLRGTLDTATGTITVTEVDATGEATTFTASGDGAGAVVATITHTDSGVAGLLAWTAVRGGDQGDAGPAGADGAPGDSVDIIFRRSASQPATPSPSSTVPADWYSSVSAVPAGSDPLWSSVGLRAGGVTDYTWQVPLKIEGEDGTDGADGLAVAELLIYRRAASAPATPTGGSYDFDTQALSPPTGWSSGIPAGSDPVYTSRAVAAVAGQSGVDSSLVWSAPVRTFQDGAEGSAGTDGAPGIAPFSRFAGGVGVLSSIRMTPNQLANGSSNPGEIRLESGVLFFQDGTSYTLSSDRAVTTPYEGGVTAETFYVMVHKTTSASALFGAGFESHRFFAAEYDAGADQWKARGNGDESVAFTPDANFAIAGIGSRVSTGSSGIERLVQFGANLKLDANSAPVFFENASITSALIKELSVEKLLAGNITVALNLTTGNLQVSNSGKIFSGKSTYGANASGFFLGRDGGVPKFKVGDASGDNELSWNGSTLAVTGDLKLSSYSPGGMVIAIAPARRSTGNVDGWHVLKEFTFNRKGTVRFRYQVDNTNGNFSGEDHIRFMQGTTQLFGRNLPLGQDQIFVDDIAIPVENTPVRIEGVGRGSPINTYCAVENVTVGISNVGGVTSITD